MERRVNGNGKGDIEMIAPRFALPGVKLLSRRMPELSRFFSLAGFGAAVLAASFHKNSSMVPPIKPSPGLDSRNGQEVSCLGDVSGNTPQQLKLSPNDASSPELRLVNMARVSYGAPELESLLPGQPRSASFCPIGRSLRKGVEGWLFIAVGTRYLRVWAPGLDSAAIAKGILAAWGMPEQRLVPSVERGGFVLLPLPAALSKFLEQFDRGLLPAYQGELDPEEVLGLKELAHRMPIPGRQISGVHAPKDCFKSATSEIDHQRPGEGHMSVGPEQGR